MPGHYLHIDQGQGGVYELPTITYNARGDDREVSIIGTSHCFTCVGVHIRLNDDGSKCFAAHISADLSDATVALIGRTGDAAKLSLDEEQAKSLYSQVRSKLHNIFELREWVKNTDPATRAKNVFVVCPVSENPQGRPLVGHHIVRAIQDFCELDELTSDQAHGFCIGMYQEMVKANFS